MSSKTWAKEYILDPLTAPEPSQETGLGSSHYRSASHSTDKENDKFRFPQGRTAKQGRTTPPQKNTYPTPPGSTSPTRSQFSSNNPYSSSPSSSKEPASQRQNVSPPNSPPRRSGHSRGVSLPQFGPSHPFTRQQTPPHRSSSARYADPPFSREQGNNGKSAIQRSASTRTYNPPSFQRRSVLVERYPGDMSHRPLDMIKKENRVAERNHFTRHKPRQASETDIIDQLDTIGGTYHHGGPYDATLISRNMKKKYSPVAAVEESNNEAIRATPREYIEDSLTKHKPLQGTASIPAGERDLSGNVMAYEEGADLMREPDAPGGAYKRWDGIQYHPDDLKGKGEPSYTIERDAKGKRAELDHLLGPGAYELQSGVNRSSSTSHQRTSSAGTPRGMSSGTAFGENDSDVRRSNTTGKKLSDGIKRRIGSIRRKKDTET